MKYLCLGYGDRARMDSLPKAEMKEILRRCVPYVEDLNTFKGMIAHHSVSWDPTILRASNGKVVVTDGPYTESKEQIGSFFFFEARDREEAIRVASRHPSANMGEDLGFRIEIREITEFNPE